MLTTQMSYWEYCKEYNKPFITYRLPQSHQQITLVLQKQNILSFTEYKEIASLSGFIFTPFDTNQNQSYFAIPEEVLINDKGFRGDLFLDKTKIKDISRLREYDESKKDYETKFQKMHDLLKNDLLQKIILSRTETLHNVAEEELIYTYYNLIQNYPKAMVYWVHMPHLGVVWMGATPETLLSQKGKDLYTMALAGTKQGAETWTNKEKEEQKLVADYIQEKLKNFSPQHSETKTVDTGIVQHLATSFHIVNEASNFFPILEKLHPTPAICGLPQHKAFEAICQIEENSRRYYCGILGPINIDDTTATFVNLRCMQVAENSVRLYAGGGLTKDSILEKEWLETERKIETLQKFLH